MPLHRHCRVALAGNSPCSRYLANLAGAVDGPSFSPVSGEICMPAYSFFRLPLALAALLFIILGGQSSSLAHDPAHVIKFGIYPYESVRTLYSLFEPAAKRIEQATGKKVELVSAPDQEAFIAKARQGYYDLALASPNSFFMMQPAGYHVIARGEPSFRGAAIVRSDSPITEPRQLRGKKIAALGTYSYGGYLFFRQELAGLGISPGQDVAFSFLDKADSVLLSVVNKQYDAGVLRLDTLDRPAFAAVRGQVRVISRSQEIPQFPFVVKDSMDPQTVHLIVGVLTALTAGKEEDRGMLRSLQIERIVAAQDADYDAFRKVMDQAKK
jgi:phosphonate transport system substrate-binding protein